MNKESVIIVKALPVVHLNGTHPEVLLLQYKNLYDKIMDLELEFLSLEFHPRDYYPKGDTYWLIAKQIKDNMRTNIQELRIWTEDHITGLQEHVKPKI